MANTMADVIEIVMQVETVIITVAPYFLTHQQIELERRYRDVLYIFLSLIVCLELSKFSAIRIVSVRCMYVCVCGRTCDSEMEGRIRDGKRWKEKVAADQE